MRRQIIHLSRGRAAGPGLVQQRHFSSFVARHLYRNCLRSLKMIRKGNAHDVREFEELQEEKKQDSMAMSPVLNYQDSMESRYQYYLQYLREEYQNNHDASLQYAVSLIRRGEEQRKWLLKDMKYENNVHALNESLLQTLLTEEEDESHTSEEEDGDDDPCFSDESDEEEGGGLPEWYRNKRS